jgi:hypothetical protein
MQSDVDMTDDHFQALALGQPFYNKIWGTVADFINVT